MDNNKNKRKMAYQKGFVKKRMNQPLKGEPALPVKASAPPVKPIPAKPVAKPKVNPLVGAIPMSHAAPIFTTPEQDAADAKAKEQALAAPVAPAVPVPAVAPAPVAPAPEPPKVVEITTEQVGTITTEAPSTITESPATTTIEPVEPADITFTAEPPKQQTIEEAAKPIVPPTIPTYPPL